MGLVALEDNVWIRQVTLRARPGQGREGAWLAVQPASCPRLALTLGIGPNDHCSTDPCLN